MLEFGLIPELVGRLPIVVPLSPLDEEALIRILTEPKNAPVKQYQHYFAVGGADLELTDEALNPVAHKAMSRNTGARALRAILEEVMLELMYDLPDMDCAGVTYIMDEDVINGGKKLADLKQVRKKESA